MGQTHALAVDSIQLENEKYRMGQVITWPVFVWRVSLPKRHAKLQRNYVDSGLIGKENGVAGFEKQEAF